MLSVAPKVKTATVVSGSLWQPNARSDGSCWAVGKRWFQLLGRSREPGDPGL